MTVLSPLALLLLLTVPLLVYIGWPRNRFRRTRDSTSLFLRMVIITLVILALADLQIVHSADQLAVVFLLDVSDSMDTASQEAAQQYIRDTLAHMRPDDLAAVVAFGADAQVARSMTSARELGPVRVTPNTGNTNLAGAIRLGLALFPGDTARRIVVLSDGLPTIGNTMAAAQLADAANVEISYVLFTRSASPEIQVRDVFVPTILNENQEFNLIVSIVSEQYSRATITVQAGGEIVNRQEVDLLAGENAYTLRLRSGASGFRDFWVQIDPPENAPDLFQDGFYQNNKLGAFSRVEGAPRVLVVSGQGEEESRYIVAALVQNGLEVSTTTASGLPSRPAGLVDYDSVVLVNVPATALSNRSMEVLQTYVSDLGGGLVVVGGDQAYGPGGYFQTPLEEALPVEMQLKDEERMPQLTIVYLIDHSGSMGITGRQGGPSRLDLVKEAVIRSIDFLQPTDRAGVASFDIDAYWIAAIQDVSDRYELQRHVATLRPGGGTSIMAGMQTVRNIIIQESSPLKHLILLTDGMASSSGLVELTANLNQYYNVTTSVVEVGPGPTAFLEQMTEVSGGHYHHVTDLSTIPAIFAQETVLATRAYIQEDTFVPAVSTIHPIMQSIDALPPLLGYVATSPRAAAQVVLRGPGPYEDPILAAWQYGLGRSVAFTSDATARWAQHWVTWDRYATFWSQVVRWTIVEGAANNLETRVVMGDEQAQVIVDARDNEGQFLNGLNLQANIVFSTGENMRQVLLRQVAPGHYEGSFTPTEEGAYLVRISPIGSQDELNALALQNLNLNQTTGWVMSYSPEYEIRERTDDTLLETIADLTDGSNLADVPEAVFEHNIQAQAAMVPLWRWLILAALLLLPLDVAVRRLLVTRGDVQRLRVWLFGKEAPRRVASDRLESLKQARDRVRRQTTGGEAQDAEVRHSPVSTVGALRSHRERSRTEREQPGVQPLDESSQPSYTRKKELPVQLEKTTPPDWGNIGARLLKRRRGQPNEEDEE